PARGDGSVPCGVDARHGARLRGRHRGARLPAAQAVHLVLQPRQPHDGRDAVRHHHAAVELLALFHLESGPALHGDAARPVVRDLYLAGGEPRLRDGMDPGAVAARSFARTLPAAGALRMSIELRNVTKKVRMGPVRVTYSGLDLTIPDGARMALLGRKEAGLEKIVDLICAADAPDKGYVTRTQSIS